MHRKGLGPEHAAPQAFPLSSCRSSPSLPGMSCPCDLSHRVGEAETPLAFVLSRSRTVGLGRGCKQAFRPLALIFSSCFLCHMAGPCVSISHGWTFPLGLPIKTLQFHSTSCLMKQWQSSLASQTNEFIGLLTEMLIRAVLNAVPVWWQLSKSTFRKL